MKKDVFDCGFESQGGMKPSLFRFHSGEMGVSLYNDRTNSMHYYCIQNASEVGNGGNAEGESLREEVVIPNKQGGIQSVVYATNNGIEVSFVNSRFSVCFVNTSRS